MLTFTKNALKINLRGKQKKEVQMCRLNIKMVDLQKFAQMSTKQKENMEGVNYEKRHTSNCYSTRRNN